MQYFKTIVLLCAALASHPIHAEPETVPLDSDRWVWKAREQRIEEYLGRPSVFLRGGIGWVDDVEFTDGVVEFEINFTGERGFVGAIWRIQDPRNYEEFYVRPHQSGKPDACQYTPIFNGAAGWQLYHGEGFAASVTLPRDEWIPVRIVFAGSRGEVYIGDMDRPAVPIHELKHTVGPGKVGLMAGSFAPAWFSNFRFEAASKPPRLKSRFKKPPVAEAGTIRSWRVSNAIAEKQLEGKVALAADDKAGLSWSELAAEASGIANLARVQPVDKDHNTAFVRVTLHSEAARAIGFRFGYSDRVKVYLNDRLLYSGDNTYRTRDYRYLGTIGLFDEVSLALNRGDNELWLAVTEDFGGWGVIGVVESAPGVSISPGS